MWLPCDNGFFFSCTRILPSPNLTQSQVKPCRFFLRSYYTHGFSLTSRVLLQVCHRKNTHDAEKITDPEHSGLLIRLTTAMNLVHSSYS